jgi:D-hexose-6-phosphate mutarotase
MPLPASVSEIASLITPADGLALVRIETALCKAEITLQGAHVLQFQPAGAAPMLFVSRSSFHALGKPIRGGVPVCFPWFGPRAGQPEAPAHGFARTLPWEVESIEGTRELGATVILRLASSEATRTLWPHDFIARLRVECTRQLGMTLEVENTGATPFQFEEALHTYFAVSDVRNVAVTGLERAAYLDKTDGLKLKQLDAQPLQITAETDRIFPANPATCTLEDPGIPRRIIVDKSGSQTTVVWNPWIAKAAALPDFGDDEWPQMLCIETANTGTDAITLAPGARHAMSATVRLG